MPLSQEEEAAKAEEEQFPDPAAVERKRAEEAEKWRLQQLKAGASSEDNANFQVCPAAVHGSSSDGLASFGLACLALLVCISSISLRCCCHGCCGACDSSKLRPPLMTAPTFRSACYTVSFSSLSINAPLRLLKACKKHYIQQHGWCKDCDSSGMAADMHLKLPEQTTCLDVEISD